MAGFINNILDPDQWACSPSELSRVMGDQLDDDLAGLSGRRDWIEARWNGPVALVDDALERWIEGWRAECRLVRREIALP